MNYINAYIFRIKLQFIHIMYVATKIYTFLVAGFVLHVFNSNISSARDCEFLLLLINLSFWYFYQDDGMKHIIHKYSCSLMNRDHTNPDTKLNHDQAKEAFGST